MFNLKILKLFLSVCICFYLLTNLSCQSKQKIDLRTLAPAETLIYLETNDLGNVFQTFTESKSWKKMANSTPSFSVLNQMQIAVAVTGFETFGEAPILQFKPKFIAIANTNLSESNNLTLLGTKINEFVKGNYGEETKLEKLANKFIWTANDGRKVFANTSEQIVYFSNDETLLEKCLSVKRGESENFTKNESLAKVREQTQDAIAFGYVTPEAIPQLANFSSIYLAMNTAEDEDSQSAIAKILPTILQKTVKEIVWTARKNEQGIEDKIFIKTDAETAKIGKETISASSEITPNLNFVPQNVSSVTLYNLENPQLAWRGLILSTSNKLDGILAKVFPEFANSMLESYGISNAENFLSSIKSDIYTIKIDQEKDESVVVANIKDEAKLKQTIAIDFKKKAEKISNADVWKTEDVTLAMLDGKIFLGEDSDVLRCLKTIETNQRQEFNLNKTNAVATTFNLENPSQVIDFFTDVNESAEKTLQYTKTETTFTTTGIERKVTSDFGLIGQIIETVNEN
jgi:hypothetical protein